MKRKDCQPVLLKRTRKTQKKLPHKFLRDSFSYATSAYESESVQNAEMIAPLYFSSMKFLTASDFSAFINA